MRSAFLALLLFSLPVCAQQQPSAAQQQKINHDASVELAFRSPVKKKMVFLPAGTGYLKGNKLMRYSVAVPGLAAGGPYILMTWDIGTAAPIVSMKKVMVDGKGALRCDAKATDCPGAEPNSSLVIGVTGMPGQPRRFVLTGQHNLALAMGEVVPFPTSGSDHGCSIEAIPLLPNGAEVLVSGRGFKPGEAVGFSSKSYEEAVSNTRQANRTGDVIAMVLPFVKGHDEGTTSISFQAGSCHPVSSFHWGKYREVPAAPSVGK